MERMLLFLFCFTTGGHPTRSFELENNSKEQGIDGSGISLEARWKPRQIEGYSWLIF